MKPVRITETLLSKTNLVEDPEWAGHKPKFYKLGDLHVNMDGDECCIIKFPEGSSGYNTFMRFTHLSELQDFYKLVTKGDLLVVDFSDYYSELPVNDYRFTILPSFKSIPDAMCHAIDYAKSMIDKGKVMVATYGGPAHPLSGTMERLKEFGVEVIAPTGCEVVNYEDSWCISFNTVMRDQTVRSINTNLEVILHEFVYRAEDCEHGLGYYKYYQSVLERNKVNPNTEGMKVFSTRLVKSDAEDGSSFNYDPPLDQDPLYVYGDSRKTIEDMYSGTPVLIDEVTDQSLIESLKTSNSIKHL